MRGAVMEGGTAGKRGAVMTRGVVRKRGNGGKRGAAAKFGVPVGVGVPMALTLLAGCSGEHAPGKPAGYTAVRTKRVALAYPSGWRRVPDKAAAFSAQSADARVRLAVLERLGSATDAGLAMALAQSGVQLSDGYRIVTERPAKVYGARSGRRADYTYTITEAPGRTVPVEAVDLAMVDGDRLPAVVRISWQRGALDQATVNRIVAAVRMF